MGVISTGLMTVEEFRRLPEDKGPVYHELRHGEVVAVTRPTLKHSLIQGKLRDLLRKFAEPGSYVDSELAFRPLPEYELWVADGAYVSAEGFPAVRRSESESRRYFRPARGGKLTFVRIVN